MNEQQGNLYPSSEDQIKAWCEEYQIPLQEGHKRFASFVILQCFAASPRLSQGLVFKGGNALRFIYKNPRSTVDLDFSVLDDCLDRNVELFRQTLDKSLLLAKSMYDIHAKTQSIKPNPKPKPHNPEATHPTYEVKVGYQFRNEKYYNRVLLDKKVASVIPLDISFSDVICDSIMCDLPGGKKGKLRVGTT